MSNHLKDAWPDPPLPLFCCDQVFPALHQARRHLLFDHQQFIPCLRMFIDNNNIMIGKLNQNERIVNQWWQKRILNNDKAIQLMKLVNKHPSVFGRQLNSENIVCGIIDDILDNIVADPCISCPMCSSVFYKRGEESKSNQLLNHFIQSCSMLHNIWKSERYQILPTCVECDYVATSFQDLVLHKTSIHGLLGKRLIQHIIFLLKNLSFKKLDSSVKFEIFRYNTVRLFFLDQSKSDVFGTADKIRHNEKTYCITPILSDNVTYGIKMKRIKEFFRNLRDNVNEIVEQTDPDLWKVHHDHDYISQERQHQYNDDFQVGKRKMKCCLFCGQSISDFENLESFLIHISAVHLEFLFPDTTTCPWNCQLDPTECPDRTAFITHLVTFHKALPKYLIKFICSINSDFCGTYFLAKLRKVVFYLRFHAQFAKQEMRILVLLLNKVINKKQLDDDEGPNEEEDSYEALDQELLDESEHQQLDEYNAEKEQINKTQNKIVSVKTEVDKIPVVNSNDNQSGASDAFKLSSFAIKQEQLGEKELCNISEYNPDDFLQLTQDTKENLFADDYDDENTNMDMEKDPLSLDDHEAQESIADDHYLDDVMQQTDISICQEADVVKVEEECHDLYDSKELIINIIDDIISSTINAIETQFFCTFCNGMLIDFHQRENKYELHLAHHHFPKMIYECKIKLFWLASWACYDNNSQPCILGGFGVEDYINHLITKHGHMEKWGLMRIQKLKRKKNNIETLSQFEEQELDKLISLMQDPLFSNTPHQKKTFSSLRVLEGSKHLCPLCSSPYMCNNVCDEDPLTKRKAKMISIRHLFEEHLNDLKFLWNIPSTSRYSCSRGHQEIFFCKKTDIIQHLSTVHGEFIEKLCSLFFILSVKQKLKYDGAVTYVFPRWEVELRQSLQLLFITQPRLSYYLDPDNNKEIKGIFKFSDCDFCYQGSKIKETPQGFDLSEAAVNYLNHLVTHAELKDLLLLIPKDYFSCSCSNEMDDLGFEENSFIIHHLLGHDRIVSKLNITLSDLTLEIEVLLKREKSPAAQNRATKLLTDFYLISKLLIAYHYFCCWSGDISLDQMAYKDMQSMLSHIQQI